MATAHEFDTWLFAQPATCNGGTLDTNRMHTLSNSFVDHLPYIDLKNKNNKN
jgi:hypothetical protein